MTTTDIVAVLTGDIIASRSARVPMRDVFDALRAAAHDFGAAHSLDLRFTRFRGDGWQVVLTRPALVLDAAIFLHARLTAAAPEVGTRIAAGIGPAESLGTADLSDAAGPAFYLSGEALDTIGRRRFAVAAATTPDWLPAIFDLVAAFVAGWTRAQAEAVALALLPGTTTHEDIAGRLGISRQAVQARLSSAGFPAFDAARAAVTGLDHGGLGP